MPPALAALCPPFIAHLCSLAQSDKVCDVRVGRGGESRGESRRSRGEVEEKSRRGEMQKERIDYLLLVS